MLVATTLSTEVFVDGRTGAANGVGVVIQLIRLNRLDPSHGSLRELLQKHGTQSEEPVRPTENLDLEFPDWSGMDDSSARITPEAAFRLCELYPRLLGKPSGKADRRSKAPFPEFVL
jgi:hypothetical protein